MNSICHLINLAKQSFLVARFYFFVAKDEFMRANAAEALGFLSFGCIWHHSFHQLYQLMYHLDTAFGLISDDFYIFIYFVLWLVRAQGVPSRSPES